MRRVTMSRHSKVLLILGTATLCVYIFLFFAESKKTEISHLAMNKKHIREKILNMTEQNSTPVYRNITTRSKLQQSLVDNFCSRIDYNEVITRRDLFKHLLFDDNYKIIYCFIPKTGCTKMKTLFLLLQGLYSLEQLFNKTVTHKNYLKKVKTLADLSVEERNVRLKSYYKFMIVRDPLERFVSGYRNKIGRSHAPKRFIKLQKDIMKDIHRYGFFFKRNPSFSEFVQYFLAHNEVFDDHFKPMVDICHPCYVKYHFYADFGMLDYDIDNFLRQMDIPIYFYFNGIRNVESLMPKDHYMTSYVPYYFNQLNDHLKKELMKNLIIDTQFYNNVSSS